MNQLAGLLAVRIPDRFVGVEPAEAEWAAVPRLVVFAGAQISAAEQAVVGQELPVVEVYKAAEEVAE